MATTSRRTDPALPSSDHDCGAAELCGQELPPRLLPTTGLTTPRCPRDARTSLYLEVASGGGGTVPPPVPPHRGSVSSAGSEEGGHGGHPPHDSRVCVSHKQRGLRDSGVTAGADTSRVTPVWPTGQRRPPSPRSPARPEDAPQESGPHARGRVSTQLPSRMVSAPSPHVLSSCPPVASCRVLSSCHPVRALRAGRKPGLAGLTGHSPSLTELWPFRGWHHCLLRCHVFRKTRTAFCPLWP